MLITLLKRIDEYEAGFQALFAQLHTVNVVLSMRAMRSGRHAISVLHCFNVILSSLAVVHHSRRFLRAIQGEPRLPGA